MRLRPLLTLDSGPAGGVLGARYFASIYGESKVLCTDMGGTSFDVSLVEDGAFSLDDEPVLDKYTFLVPKIAISSIGSGGGSIIWVDSDGILRVGPQSAGADPGPAACGRGGVQPTVTDANLLLGYLNPSNFLGGRQTLVPRLAEAAFEKVARGAGMDVVAAAAGAFQIVNSQMADLIRRTTVEQGYDPREFVLFAYGGAAPAHAAYYARDLRLKRIYIPRYSTVFSALGMLTGGIVHSTEASFPAFLPLAQRGETQIRELYQTLETSILGQFQSEGYERGIRLQRFAYLKYRLQPRSLAVELSDGVLDGSVGEELAAHFERQYAELYGEGAGYRKAGIEIVKVRVDGTLDTVSPHIAAEELVPESDAFSALSGERNAYFLETGKFVPTSIYDGDALRFGHVLAGPCIVERMGDTIVIPPSVTGRVDEFHSLVLDVDRPGTPSAVDPAAQGGRA